MVAVRSDPDRSGVFTDGDPPRLVYAAAARGDAVAGSGRLPGGDRRRAHPRQPHRLAASPQPLRIGVAGLRAWPNHQSTGRVLLRLRAGGAGNTRGSPVHLLRASLGESGVARSRTVPVAAFPNRAASFETLASRGLDLGTDGGDDRAPRLPLR